MISLLIIVAVLAVLAFAAVQWVQASRAQIVFEDRPIVIDRRHNPLVHEEITMGGGRRVVRRVRTY